MFQLRQDDVRFMLAQSGFSLINEQQAATFLGYTVRALQNWRLLGGGPRFIEVSSRSVRYGRRDLIEWTEQRLRSHTSEAAA